MQIFFYTHVHAGIEDVPDIFNTSDESGDDMELQLDSLFVEPEEYEADQAEEEISHPSSSRGGDLSAASAARRSAERGNDSRIDRSQSDVAARSTSQQNRYQGESDGRSKRQKQKRQNRKRYRPYARNVTVSVIEPELI